VEFKPSGIAQTLRVVSSRVTAVDRDKLPVAYEWAESFVGLNLRVARLKKYVVREHGGQGG
jgi:hypothetical protein